MERLKMGYKYEVHMHTFEASKCGVTPGADYIAEFIKKGYDGIIITDHFFYGNTRPSREQPWEDYVEEFCKGYEAAKAEGDRQGLKVFFGWENSQRVDEYLTYGPDKAWLKAHPEIRDADHNEYLRLIHEAGGLVVEAHPFRERGYVDIVKIHPYQCDAMEVANFGNPPYQDIMAYNYCKDRGIVMTSGTDLHNVVNLENSPCGMVFDEPLNSIQDYVERIKSGKGFRPLIPEERMAPITADIKNTLPMKLYDENNVGHDIEMKDIFPGA